MDYLDTMDNGCHPLMRAKAIQHIKEIYGFQSLDHKPTPIDLPFTGKQVKLIVFPFGDMLSSLLADPIAMQSENLSIDPTDPFAPPKPGGKDGHYRDFKTGSVSEMAHNLHCSQPNDLLVEVTMFIDKSHLDVKGKHTVEPVMFTISLFNAEFRHKAAAWRPLGCLPNMDHIAPHATADEKAQDHHHCLRVITSELVAYQRLGGINWKICLTENGSEVDCCLQLPVNCTIGDTEGHDKLIARKVNRQGRGEHRNLCRYCNCPFELLRCPHFGHPGMTPDGHSKPIKMKLTQCADLRCKRNNLTTMSTDTSGCDHHTH